MDTVGLDTSHTEKEWKYCRLHFFKGKITIFKHTSYLSYALSSPMLMKSLVFAIWREFKK